MYSRIAKETRLAKITEELLRDIDKNTVYGIYGDYSGEISTNLIEVGKSNDLKLGSFRELTKEEITSLLEKQY